MKYRIWVQPEVDDDLLMAESWYDSQQAGLGRRFLAAVRAAIFDLMENPLLYRIRHRQYLVRWTYPRRFPYRIIYKVIGDTVIICAILHAARREHSWKDRL